MTTYSAVNVTGVLNYLKVAVDGDTILLAPGNYNALNITNVVKTGNVTITSADSDHPAVLSTVSVKGSAGLTFTGIEMSVTRDVSFQVYGSSRIVLDNLDIHGSLDGNPNNDFAGMMVRNSTDVTVSNSHFHELTDAFNHSDTQGLKVINNTFDVIRDNGVAGGGSSNVLVANNSFTNFMHTGAIHPDAIQFWTTNTTSPASNITVTGNVITRGTGTTIQGIWITDDVGNLPYNNVMVSNNVVIGESYNGIVVSHATTATLTGNVVIGMNDQPSWLGIVGVDQATITDNQASSFNFRTSNVTSSGNVQTTAASVTAPPVAIDPTVGVIYPGVSLMGFIDGPSASGRTYDFAEMVINGNSSANRLAAGSIGTSHLYGFEGNDMLFGSKNGLTSTLEGGKGDDSYTIYQSQDVIIEQAGEGYDTVSSYVDYTLGFSIEEGRAMAAGLTLHGTAANNNLVAHSAGSILYGEAGDDVLQGDAGADQLFGGDGADRMKGADGADLLDGGAGNDSLSGGAGNDTLLGGDGADGLEGGSGADILTGGAGADTFGFRNGDFGSGDLAASMDIITDFKASEGDKISLSTMDANTKTTADDKFSFIGSQAFHGIAGELRFAADGDGITVYGDTNGDAIADMAIHLTGVTSIVASNFYL